MALMINYEYQLKFFIFLVIKKAFLMFLLIFKKMNRQLNLQIFSFKEDQKMDDFKCSQKLVFNLDFFLAI